MKVVMRIGYCHFIVPAEVAVGFLESAREVTQKYYENKGYRYHELGGEPGTTVEVHSCDRILAAIKEEEPEQAEDPEAPFRKAIDEKPL
jgi:hypothetical protein